MEKIVLCINEYKDEMISIGSNLIFEVLLF